jgi:hypothetical protein
VEECIALSVSDFKRRNGGWSAAGTIEWRCGGDVAFATGYRVIGIAQGECHANATAGRSTVVLTHGADRQEIALCASAVTFGHRYYLICPLCHRKYMTLYRPPGARVFACRRCHRLRYRSERRCSRTCAELSLKTGLPRRLVRRYLEAVAAESWRIMLRGERV